MRTSKVSGIGFSYKLHLNGKFCKCARELPWKYSCSDFETLQEFNQDDRLCFETVSHFVSPVGLKLVAILLSQLLERRDYRAGISMSYLLH